MTREARPPLLKLQHLLAIYDISSLEAIRILDLAERYVALSRQPDKREPVLQGRTQVNLFFEASTRTQPSFEIAGKPLGADVMNTAVANSAVANAEPLRINAGAHHRRTSRQRRRKQQDRTNAHAHKAPCTARV